MQEAREALEKLQTKSQRLELEAGKIGLQARNLADCAIAEKKEKVEKDKASRNR